MSRRCAHRPLNVFSPDAIGHEARMLGVNARGVFDASARRGWTVRRRSLRQQLPSRCSAVDAETAASVESTPAMRELFCFDISVQVIPHPDKVSFGGEDAYFVVDRFAFGVADGVGGWREGGVNPADYSRQMMQIAAERLEVEPDLKAALDMAHAKTRLPGSCTACLVRMDGETGELSALNLGDSGFLVLRDNSVLARTSPQQHFFDCPKQLAAFPEHCDQTDYPKDGQSFSLPLQQGDLIIMGTDGLWDNIFEDSLLRFTSNRYGRKKTVEDLSEGLARLAQRQALDREFESPYSLAALEEGYEVPWYEKLLKAKIRNGSVQWGTLTGGKLDDITVIVARVTRDSFPMTAS